MFAIRRINSVDEEEQINTRRFERITGAEKAGKAGGEGPLEMYSSHFAVVFARLTGYMPPDTRRSSNGVILAQFC